MSTGSITIVGLGPGDASLLTVQASDELRAGRVFLRTRIHPTVQDLAGAETWPSFDHLYERAEDFSVLYDEIADTLIHEAATGDLIYAVPGHPMVGESTVQRLIDRASPAGVDVCVLPAVSFLDVILPVVRVDPIESGIQIVDALALAASLDQEPFAGGSLPISPLRPAIVAQVYAPSVISAAKLALLRVYPPESPVTLIGAAGTSAATVSEVALHEVDHRKVDHLSSLYIPAVDPLVGGRTSDSLQQITARLRAPDGCPWDQEQTHGSLTRNLIEEAYEVLDAIERDEPREMQEEFGDLLLQVYLHSQIAEEAGEFTLEDVFESITSKLVRRHPHVFGDAVAETAGEVAKNWDQIKRLERERAGRSEQEHPLGSIPKALPALSRAQTVSRRAERGSFKTASLARAKGQADRLSQVAPISEPEELAALIAGIVWLANHEGIDAEEALRSWSLRVENEISQVLERSGTSTS